MALRAVARAVRPALASSWARRAAVSRRAVPCFAGSATRAAGFHATSAASAPARVPEGMPTTRDPMLTRDQVEAYRKNGYITIPNFLTPGQLSMWRAAVDAAVEERGAAKFEHGGEDVTNVDFEYYDRVFTQKVNLWKTSKSVRALLMQSFIGQTAAQLEGVEGMRIWHDQALIKEPWANATAWHVDVPYWSFNSPHAISVWIALDDVTLENGALAFVTGSHRKLLAEAEDPYAEIKIGKNMRDLFECHPLLANSETVAAPMRAGSASFHNGLTAHGAFPNMTARRRRAMTVQMMPDGATYNGKQNVLTKEQMDRLKIGDTLDWEDQNPLLFKSAA